MQPLYTPENCTPAFQLRWSLALFPSEQLPPEESRMEQLRLATEKDRIRILEFNTLSTGAVVFLLSTTPGVRPPAIVKSVKGRLQHLLRPVVYVDFRRNFRLTAVGENRGEVIEKYIAGQLNHHSLAPNRLSEFQLVFEEVDLNEPIQSAHGQYILALHVVLVHAERWRIAKRTFLSVSRDAILSAAKKKRHRVSRLSLLPDHLHFTLACSYETSPEEVALSYMNNIAYKHGMLRMWMNSFYVGTIGPYDMNAVRQNSE